MGMFDELVGTCPKCGKYNIVQTKISYTPSLTIYFPEDKIENIELYDAKGDTHEICANCEYPLWFSIEGGLFKGFPYIPPKFEQKGKKLNIKATLLDEEFITNAVNHWNTEENTHPLTCGVNSCHKPLIYESGQLKCQDCNYTQKHVPSCVLKEYDDWKSKDPQIKKGIELWIKKLESYKKEEDLDAENSFE